jgi:hypothetical protein
MILKFFKRYNVGMRLFFLTIPEPLKQHPIKKKITPSAIFKDLGEKLPDPWLNIQLRLGCQNGV